MEWLATQLVAFTSQAPDRAAVYMLNSPTTVHLGYSGRRLAEGGVRRLSTLDARFVEHFRGVEKVHHSRGFTKVFRFGKADPASLVMTAVALGPRDDMRCLERWS